MGENILQNFLTQAIFVAFRSVEVVFVHLIECGRFFTVLNFSLDFKPTNGILADEVYLLCTSSAYHLLQECPADSVAASNPIAE